MTISYMFSMNLDPDVSEATNLWIWYGKQQMKNVNTTATETNKIFY